MKVALTGITGFVGQNLMPMIVEQLPDVELMTLNIETDLPKAQQLYPWKQCQHILTTESLFLLCLIFWSYIKGLGPAITNQTEQFIFY